MANQRRAGLSAALDTLTPIHAAIAAAQYAIVQWVQSKMFLVEGSSASVAATKKPITSTAAIPSSGPAPRGKRPSSCCAASVTTTQPVQGPSLQLHPEQCPACTYSERLEFTAAALGA